MMELKFIQTIAMLMRIFNGIKIFGIFFGILACFAYSVATRINLVLNWNRSRYWVLDLRSEQSESLTEVRLGRMDLANS